MSLKARSQQKEKRQEIEKRYMTLWSYTRAASRSQSDTTTDNPQIPQPDLRFVIRKQTNKSKHTAEKSGKAQQKHPFFSVLRLLGSRQVVTQCLC